MLWLLQNWKTVLTGVLLIALVATGAALYNKGSEHQRLVNDAASLRLTLSTLETVMNVQTAALEADQKRAADDAKHLKSLNERITSLDAYIGSLEDRDSTCLAGPDVDRLRDLWN